MIALLFGVGSVVATRFQYPAVGIGAGPVQSINTNSWSALDTSSTGAFIQQPAFQKSLSAMDTSSMGAFIQQPRFSKSWSALDTSSTGAFIQQPAFQKSFSALDTSSMGAFIQQPRFSKSWSALDTSSTGAFVQPAFQKSWSALDTSSMGAYVQPSMYKKAYAQPSMYKKAYVQPSMYKKAYVQPSMYKKAYAQPSMGLKYGYQAMESASATNPYNVNMLQNIAPTTVRASKVMPVKQIMGGEQHVVENDLQMHINHEADKTVLTKRLIHHSPVLHKTIRTHQIAQDVVHDKQVHHMNVVEDRVKQVPGQEYIGTKQQVDHTTANPPATQIAQPLLTKPLMKSVNLYNKF